VAAKSLTLSGKPETPNALLKRIAKAIGLDPERVVRQTFACGEGETWADTRAVDEALARYELALVEERGSAIAASLAPPLTEHHVWVLSLACMPGVPLHESCYLEVFDDERGATVRFSDLCLQYEEADGAPGDGPRLERCVPRSALFRTRESTAEVLFDHVMRGLVERRIGLRFAHEHQGLERALAIVRKLELAWSRRLVDQIAEAEAETLPPATCTPPEEVFAFARRSSAKSARVEHHAYPSRKLAIRARKRDLTSACFSEHSPVVRYVREDAHAGVVLDQLRDQVKADAESGMIDPRVAFDHVLELIGALRGPKA